MFLLAAASVTGNQLCFKNIKWKIPVKFLIAHLLMAWDEISRVADVNQPFVPNSESSDAGKSDMLMRSGQVLPLSKKVKVPDLICPKVLH